MVSTHGRSWSSTQMPLRSWSTVRGSTWHWGHLDGWATSRSLKLSCLSSLEADVLGATWVSNLDLLAANLHIGIRGETSTDCWGCGGVLRCGGSGRSRHAHLGCGSMSWDYDDLFRGSGRAWGGRSRRWATGSDHHVGAEFTAWLWDLFHS